MSGDAWFGMLAGSVLVGFAILGYIGTVIDRAKERREVRSNQTDQTGGDS